MSEDLKTIVNQSKTITIAGEQVEISPLRMMEIHPFTVELKPVINELGSILSKEIDAGVIFELAEHSPQLINAVAIASRTQVGWVGQLKPDDFMFLAMAILEVNADFFTERLMPVLTEMLDQAGGSMQGKS